MKKAKSPYKKAFIFSMDAVFAVSLLIMGLLLITTMFVSEKQTVTPQHQSEDLARALSTIRISELEDKYVQELVDNGTITNKNNTILEQIGEFWAKNQTTYAKYLARNLTEKLVPRNAGYGIYAGGEEIYSRNGTKKDILVASRKMVSGIEKGKPVLGATSQAYLTGIKDKITSKYAYFGGYEGQGNITKKIENIPPDSNFSGMYFEAALGGNTYIYINGKNCAYLQPSAGDMQAETWNLSNCTSYLNKGQNNTFSLIFTGELNESYVGGGYIRVDYHTEELRGAQRSGTIREYFPELEGLINIYSSTYIPGTPQSMGIQLNMHSNFSTRLNIAGVDIITINGSQQNQTISIGNSTLAALLNYSDLKLKTIPIRFGTLNITYYTTDYGNADVILITDLSGSMSWQLDNNNYGITRDCDDIQITEPDTTRISLAKCIDKDFISNILGSPGNKIGLVGFDGTSDDWEGEGIKVSHNLSTDESSLTNQIENDYTAGGGTCICCAINKAVEMLSSSKVELIKKGSVWKYNTSYETSTPPDDAKGNSWNETSYNDSEWKEGPAPIGFGYGSVKTKTHESYNIDLWEITADMPQPVDFTSGINSTANTFGAENGNDGWDWQCHVYGTGGSPWHNMCTLRDGDPSNGPASTTHDGTDRLEVEIGGSTYELKDSGAFGVEIEINQTIVNILKSGGEAVVSFDYEAFDREKVLGGWDETEESVWIKARFGNSSEMHWLGYDLDTGNTGRYSVSDTTPEILFDWGVIDNVFWDEDNVMGDFNMDGDGDYNAGTFRQNVTAYIKTPGTYYLDMGAVFDAVYGWQGSREGIVAYFDNINFEVANSSGSFYVRKKINISDPSKLRDITLEVYSDDNATVYINGREVLKEGGEHGAQYWNSNVTINSDLLVSGENVISAKVGNDDSAGSAFDLRMTAGDASRQQYIIVMSDGIAGYSCNPITYECGGGSSDCNNAACQPAMDDAINAAKQAYDNYGIKVYSVGFGPVETCYNANYTLKKIAEYGNGTYYASDNASELQLIYTQLADEIVSASRESQTYSIEGNYSKSRIYEESYIEINYTPSVSSAEFGEITVTVQEGPFENCSQTFPIYPDMRILDAKVTSYSGKHWTNHVFLDGESVFNLTEFGDEYPELGDPYIIQIPPDMLSPGNRTIEIRTGDDEDNSTGCSLNNSFIYTAAIKGTIGYTEVLESADGCEWTIEFENGKRGTLKVPSDYSGSKKCAYTSSNVTYDKNDTIDTAVYTLLSQLDFNNDNRSNINIDEQDMTINAIWVPKVPYMWGPTVVEVRSWQ